MIAYNEDDRPGFDQSQRTDRLGERIDRIIKMQTQAIDVMNTLENRLSPVLSPEETEKSVPMDSSAGADLHPAPSSSLAGILQEIAKNQERLLRRLSAVVERIDL